MHNSSYNNITKNNKYNKNNKIIKKKKKYTKTRNINYKNIHPTSNSHSHTNNLNVLNKNDLTLQTLKQSQNIQYGGLFGIDFVKLHWKMNKFNNIISKLNNYDSKMQKDIESYKIQAKTFEMRAQDKAAINTEIINNLRNKIMIDLYQRDEQEMPKKQTSAITIASSYTTLNNNMTKLNKRSKQLDKEIGKDMPEYLRLMKTFDAKIKKFNKITKAYATESKFYQEIQEIKRSYDIILENKKALSGLSSSDKKKIKKFESNKTKYMKVLNLSDSVLQARKLIEHEISELLKSAEYNIAQFGTYKGKQKKKAGVLDEQMSVINCANNYGSGLLCEWNEKYVEFADFLIELIAMCKDIVEKLKLIEHSADICFYNLSIVITDYKTDAHPEVITKFKNDIHELIGMLDLITKSIELLKVEFYKQTPATHLLLDTNEILYDLNYTTSKLTVYYTIFKEIEEIKEGKQDNPDKQDKLSDYEDYNISYNGDGGGHEYYILNGGSAAAVKKPSGPSLTNSLTYKVLFKDMTIGYFRHTIINYRKNTEFISDLFKKNKQYKYLDNMYTIYMFLIKYCYSKELQDEPKFIENMNKLQNNKSITKVEDYTEIMTNIHTSISLNKDDMRNNTFGKTTTNNETIENLLKENTTQKLIRINDYNKLNTFLENISNDSTDFKYDEFETQYTITPVVAPPVAPVAPPLSPPAAATPA